MDPYLLHRVARRDRDIEDPSEALDDELRLRSTGVEVPRMPALLRVRAPAGWQPTVAGVEVGARIGDVVTVRASPSALRELLEGDPDVLDVEVSRDVGEPELVRSTQQVRADLVHRPPIDERGDAAIVAVIDAGIDVLHDCFTDASGRTRFLGVWDQHDEQHGYRAYGREHTPLDIERYRASHTTEGRIERDAWVGHGTHVASIAAGRATAGVPSGIAPEAKLIVVRPRILHDPDDPRSIGYSMAHVDALSYIAELADQQRRPVVVNLSLGMHAGAHDGTTLLESAMDAFTAGGRAPGRVIVKSAGNSAATAHHAAFVLRAGRTHQLRWISHDVRRKEDLFELWFPSSCTLTARLRAPGRGRRDLEVDLAHPFVQSDLDGNLASMSYRRFHRDNGRSQLLVAISALDAPIHRGRWSLEITPNVVVGDARLDAWSEPRTPAAAAFLTHVDARGTLSVPGTARTVITVGAVDAQGDAAPFSSRGPSLGTPDKPELSAPGVGIRAARAGTQQALEMDGTSMAAPHVTGAIALLLSRAAKRGGAIPNAAQARAALIQSAEGFDGRHDPARGYGRLDVERLLALFEGER